MLTAPLFLRLFALEPIIIVAIRPSASASTSSYESSLGWVGGLKALMSCDVGVYCFVWLIMRSPSRAILSFRRSLEVEAVHLDSVMETLSLPAHLDAALGFVQSSILDEHRWPLRFSALSKHLPVLWSTWCAVYSLCAQLLCLC